MRGSIVSLKRLVWDCRFRLILETDNVTVTLNSDQYCEMFDTFLQARLYALNIIHCFWFKLNRATAHSARRTMETFEREAS